MDKLSVWLGRYLGSTGSLLIAFVLIAGINTYAFLFPEHRDSINIIAGAWTGYVAVFFTVLLQNSGNRHASALHAKLDEVIASIDQAHNNFIRAEELSEAEIEELRNAHKAAYVAPSVFYEGRSTNIR